MSIAEPEPIPANETEAQQRKRTGQPHIRRECECGAVHWYKSPSAKKTCPKCRERIRKQSQRRTSKKSKKEVSRGGTIAGQKAPGSLPSNDGSLAVAVYPQTIKQGQPTEIKFTLKSLVQCKLDSVSFSADDSGSDGLTFERIHHKWPVGKKAINDETFATVTVTATEPGAAWVSFDCSYRDSSKVGNKNVSVRLFAPIQVKAGGAS